MITETKLPTLWQPRLERHDPWTWLPPIFALVALVAVLATGTNIKLFLTLNHPLPGGDWLWPQFTVLGDGLIAIGLLALWLRYPRLIWAGCLAAILAALWTHGIKATFPMPRPAAVLPPEMIHVIGKAYRYGSFPSGHSTTIFTLAGVLALSLPRSPWRWLPLLLAIPVALSRSAVGAHWPIDLLAGMLGGWLAALGGIALAARWSWGERAPGRYVLVGLILLACVLMPFFNSGYPQARVLQMVLGVLLFTWGLRALYSLRVARPG